jgi:hypothetical protein
MSTLNRRRALARTYIANAALHFPGDAEVAGRFMCPICFDDFPIEAVETDDPEVNLAHVWPESLGGKLATLACTACNSEMGTKYEHHLCLDFKLVDAFTGKAKVNGRLMTTDGSSMGVTITKPRPNHFHLDEIEAQTHKKQAELITTAMASGKMVNLTMTFRTPDTARFCVALLHSAHLALYRYFGMEYLRFGNTKRAREILKRDKTPDDFRNATFDLPRADYELPPGMMFNPMVIKYAGEDERCIGVPVPSADPTISAKVVMMPGLSPDALDQYEAIMSRTRDGKQRLVAHGELEPWPAEARLVNEKATQYGRWWWRTMGEKVRRQRVKNGDRKLT